MYPCYNKDLLMKKKMWDIVSQAIKYAHVFPFLITLTYIETTVLFSIFITSDSWVESQDILFLPTLFGH